MNTTDNQQAYTLQQWLQLEDIEGRRYEFLDGKVFVKQGGTFNYGTISDNAYYAIRSSIDEAQMNYRAFGSSSKLEVQTSKFYTYPTVQVVAGDVQLSRMVRGAILNPVAIVEVLPINCSFFDHIKRVKSFFSVPTLQEYVLLNQSTVEALHYRKHQEAGQFWTTIHTGADTTLHLESIDVKLKLADLYLNVDLPIHK